MKKNWLFLLPLAAFGAPALADTTFITEPLSMGEVRSVDVELRPSYRSDRFKSGGTDFTHKLTRIDLISRVVPLENVEAQLTVPHVSAKVSGGSLSETESGLSQVILGGKYAFRPDWGALVEIETPTGDQDDGLGEGTNVGVAALFERVVGERTARVNVGYLFKSKYKPDYGAAAGGKKKTDPGDIIQLNAALTKHIAARGVDVTGELNVSLIGDSEVGGSKVSDSGGTGVDLLLGVGREVRDWYLKGALVFGLGAEEVTSVDLNRGAGDFRLILGASRRFAY
jgi:hypothetical protein